MSNQKRIGFSEFMGTVLNTAMNTAKSMRHEYITPEHMLYALLQEPDFIICLSYHGADGQMLYREIKEWLINQEALADVNTIPVPSAQFTEALKNAMDIAETDYRTSVLTSDFVAAMLKLEESEAAYLLGSAVEGSESSLYLDIDDLCDEIEIDIDDKNFDDNEVESDGECQFARKRDEYHSNEWKSLVSNISEEAKAHTPLIGREKEMDRTIQILCRKDKNNPLHVGDPGVGKTALIYGLATLINTQRVPKRLQNRKIYGMNIGSLLAGAQYRGDFEKRLKSILDGAKRENAILYLDEIHNIIGAGRNSDGGPDASNILKPYLEMGSISFIGATTHDEYNRKMVKDKAVMRRFQTIDIQEPSIEETIQIVLGLQKDFQKFHNVTYRKDALEYAVRASAKHINDRRLPDKAIDLIDEAGAYLEVHPNSTTSRNYVTKKNIDDILMKVCKIQAESLVEDSNECLAELKSNILAQIYGQETAVDTVTNAIMMAKAGLNDDEKPLASLLFVGPTGVGKTEVARVLAKQLGVELVRFDMSEYTEKHTVAKLIGSPAGYVGYEDGGLLTAAIRKTPNCVLLLDEIEKAHSDIYNILLQVMDYAKLTDNRGDKVDFRNVVLIMTSNAGAQYAAQAGIGFGGGVPKGEAMMKQVKKTFKPEFINRLTDTVVFNDMDEKMASMILHKKLNELSGKLIQKDISITVSDKAFAHLLEHGFTKEYGAREIDRVVAKELKPLLMKEILFGKLKKGSSFTVDIDNNCDRLAIKKDKD